MFCEFDLKLENIDWQNGSQAHRSSWIFLIEIVNEWCETVCVIMSDLVNIVNTSIPLQRYHIFSRLFLVRC